MAATHSMEEQEELQRLWCQAVQVVHVQLDVRSCASVEQAPVC